MPLQIQSTHLVEDGMSAIVEIAIAESTDLEASSESLLIRVKVELGPDSYLPAIQREALRRVHAICEQIETDLRAKWTKRA